MPTSAITFPIALLLWGIGLIVYFGLPNYYRQAPGKMPSFYKSLFRRKIVVWFFVTVIIQNFFLSAPYGRNWTCKLSRWLGVLKPCVDHYFTAVLWSSKHATAWQIVLLVILFFVIVWDGLLGKSTLCVVTDLKQLTVSLAVLSKLSKDHSWILPVFAIGLGRAIPSCLSSVRGATTDMLLQELLDGRKSGGAPVISANMSRGLAATQLEHLSREVSGSGWASWTLCRE